jgi:N-acetylmuramoyl-L-alanine amidase
MLIDTNIKLLVVHCSDTENHKDLKALDIHKMHLGFGWDGIGYHKVICRSGKIENGRPEYWIGAHVKGHNNTSLGVCLIGRDKFTAQQFHSLESVLRSWKLSYPKTDIIGHYNIFNTEKTCPNFDVKAWCKDKNL